MKQHLKNAPHNAGKLTIPASAVGKAVVRGSLGLAAADGVYRIFKALKETNKEIKSLHTTERNAMHDNLIKLRHADSVKKQAAAKALRVPEKKKNLRPTVKPGNQGSKGFNQSKWD